MSFPATAGFGSQVVTDLDAYITTVTSAGGMSDAEHSSLYTAYKTTIGQGLSLP